MRFREGLPPRYAGLRSRLPLYVAALVALAFCFLHQETTAMLVRHAGSRNSYVALLYHGLFLLVLLEAAVPAGVAVVAFARWRSWPVRTAVVGRPARRPVRSRGKRPMLGTAQVCDALQRQGEPPSKSSEKTWPGEPRKARSM